MEPLLRLSTEAVQCHLPPVSLVLSDHSLPPRAFTFVPLTSISASHGAQLSNYSSLHSHLSYGIPLVLWKQGLFQQQFNDAIPQEG